MATTLKIANSLKLYKEALKYLPAGVSSNARLWYDGICPPGLPCQIYIKKAMGSKVWDVDNNKYIDYRLGFGPVILGHGYKKITRAVHETEKKGAVYAAGNELEVTVAKKICRMVPCAEMIRFSSTGTEATMHSLRIARAFTGKEKIIKFEGHFHGTHDYLAWSTANVNIKKISNYGQIPEPASLGIPNAIKDLVLVERWNDFEAIEKTVKENHNKVAAIITEPIMGNAGAIMPRPGYLKHLRELCDKYNIVLIFDEVKTGFRVAPGGAQELFKVIPDIACFAKAMGNGYPVSAIAGKKEIMELIKPHGVMHGGTYSSNPISLTAVNVTLDEIRTGKVHARINKLGKKLMSGISEILSERKIKHVMQGVPSMFQVACGAGKISDFRDLHKCNLWFYPMLQKHLMERGVIVDYDIEEPLYMSYSHSKEDIEKTLRAYERACGEIVKRKKIVPQFSARS